MSPAIVAVRALSDTALAALSRDRVLSLSLLEMKTVQRYFRRLRREPTDTELETIAQTWSEHCKHKTLTGIIRHTEIANGKKRVRIYDNLLKKTVFRATRELKKPWCLSVFRDNAGVIRFDDETGVAFKVETHNHPSALEPYGGAATGIGGVIRDILGVGLGAKPLANTDVFCFGRPDLAWSRLPEGVLHPRRVIRGVVAGVRDYGNRMGIPTVNGAVWFDEGYTSNPLVFCGTMGIIPSSMVDKQVKAGDLVVVAGGRTGRDGIHGATFSSVELDKDSDVSAVQIGNPIVEKKLLDTVLQARDKGLYRAITDCGAGGLSSAVGELGEETGVRVHLEKVPLKYAGLKPWEIWVSEAQERMVMAVPPARRDELLALFAAENVEAVVIGEFTGDGVLTVMHGGEAAARLEMSFLHGGIPRPVRQSTWTAPRETARPRRSAPARSLGSELKKILSGMNVCSREWIIRQYDHEVQGQTVIKPLQGPAVAGAGPGDAAVIWPYASRPGTWRGVVLSNGLNPEFGKIDGYWMAAAAIDEALRNAACVGGDIERMAILDNFCWGNPDKPEVLGSLVRAAEACYDMAKIFGTPFISGKDSLNNEYASGAKTLSIPGCLLISAMGVIEDVRATVTMDLKAAGDPVYLAGLTAAEAGGSQLNVLHKITGGRVPRTDAKRSRALMIALRDAIRAGYVRACHDCSEGGLAVAAAEMAFAGARGCAIDLAAVPAQGRLLAEELLFAESTGRFLIEVAAGRAADFEKAFKGLPFARVGSVTGAKTLAVTGLNGQRLIAEPIASLYNSWSRDLI